MIRVRVRFRSSLRALFRVTVRVSSRAVRRPLWPSGLGDPSVDLVQ